MKDTRIAWCDATFNPWERMAATKESDVEAALELAKACGDEVGRQFFLVTPLEMEEGRA